MGRSVEEVKKEVMKKAFDYENIDHGCSQSTMTALMEVLGIENEDLMKSVTALGGGVAFEAKYCGSLLSGILLLGARCGGRASMQEGFPGIIRAVIPAHRLVDRYVQKWGTTTCKEVIASLHTGKSLYGAASPDEKMLQFMAANPKMMESKIAEFDLQCAKVCEWVVGTVIDIMDEEGYEF